MPNPRKLSRAELINFATNAATAIANGKVTGLLAAQNTAISDAITDATAALSASDLNSVEARAASLEATQIANDNEDALQNLLSDARFTMVGVNATASEFDAVGFDPPDDVRSPVVPQTPSDLVAAPVANGVNEIKFKGNNGTKKVTYVVEAKIGDTAPYTIVGITSAQKWQHQGVERGQFYQYRVRAQSARGVFSNWSNEAVCYGM